MTEQQGREHDTGEGETQAREVERGANAAPAETVGRDRGEWGSGGDVMPSNDGPAIHGIRGAPPPGSVLGRERGLSKTKPQFDDDTS